MLIAASLSPWLRADGIVLPPLAAPAVTMPDQRALLVWHEKEHQETLVIESRFIGPGHDFAWVVPLPSKPTIEAATPGTLPTLASLFRPRFVDLAGYVAFWVALLAPLALCFIFPSAERKFRLMFGGVLSISMILALIASVFSPSWLEAVIAGGSVFAWLRWHSSIFGATGVLLAILTSMFLLYLIFPQIGLQGGSAGTPSAAAKIETDHTIVDGNDLTVLSGGGPDGIAQWLRDHQFALPAAAESVIADEVRAGGYFAAVKMHREDESSGEAAPTPLVFTFQTPTPVYPMALTGAGATKPLSVELFVFGDSRAEADGLEARYVENVVPERFPDWFNDWGVNYPNSSGMMFFGRWSVQLNHPALRKLCSDCSAVTLLAGTLTPAQMTRDLAIRLKPFDSRVRPAEFSARDGLALAFLAITALLVLIAPVVRWQWRGEDPPARVGRGIILAALALGASVWLAVPTVPTVSGNEEASAYDRMEAMSSQFKETAAKLPPNDTNLPALRKAIGPALVTYARTRGWPEPKESDSPGNYTFLKLPGGAWRLIWIDDFGRQGFWSKDDAAPPQSP